MQEEETNRISSKRVQISLQALNITSLLFAALLLLLFPSPRRLFITSAALLSALVIAALVKRALARYERQS